MKTDNVRTRRVILRPNTGCFIKIANKAIKRNFYILMVISVCLYRVRYQRLCCVCWRVCACVIETHGCRCEGGANGYVASLRILRLHLQNTKSVCHKLSFCCCWKFRNTRWAMPLKCTAHRPPGDKMVVFTQSAQLTNILWWPSDWPYLFMYSIFC